jgi:hypothetical protein
MVANSPILNGVPYVKAPTDSFQQPIKRKRDEEKEDAGEEVADNSPSEERLMRRDIVRRRRRVATYDQCVGDVDEA